MVWYLLNSMNMNESNGGVGGGSQGGSHYCPDCDRVWVDGVEVRICQGCGGENWFELTAGLGEHWLRCVDCGFTAAPMSSECCADLGGHGPGKLAARC